MNTLKRVAVVAALGLSFGLGSCSNDANNEPQLEPKGIPSEFSSALTLEIPDVSALDQDELKALNFQLAPNGNYRKPIIKFTEGQPVPVLCVIRNEAGVGPGRPVITEEVNFVYKAGQLVAESLPITLPTGTDLVANPTGWRMICIVGHDGYTGGSASFSTGSTLRSNTPVNGRRDIEALYMNKDKGGSASWTKLEVVNISGGGKGFQAAELTNLVSQGSMFIFDAHNTTTRNKVFTGVSLESNTLSFAGAIQGLTTTEVSDGLPKFVGTSNTTMMKLATRMSMLGGATLGAYVAYGIPDTDASTNTIKVMAHTGDNFVKARTHKYTFNPELNKFYGLGKIKISKLLTHPIEAMLFNENTNTVFVGPEDTHAQTNARNDDGEYNLPTQQQARALFPGLIRGASGIFLNEGNNAYGVVNIGDGKSHMNHSEIIEAFGDGGQSYTGDYYNPSGSNVSYAIRFKGGNGNKYLSAYRYERLGTASNPTGVKITVRVLGPTRTSTTLADISKESYWNSEPDEDQKQIVRTIDKGKYWTESIKDGSAGLKYAYLVRVFETEKKAYLDDATQSLYIADMYYHMDHPNLASNKAKYLSFTSYTD